MTTNEKGYAELLTPQEAGYNPLGSNDTQGCANCRWFISPNMCQVVSGDIAPTGLSDMYMPSPSIEMPEIEIMIGQIDEMKEKRWQPLTDWVLRKFRKPSIETKSTGFKVLDGNRWVAWFTNAFEDRDGEIFSTAALERYVQKAQKEETFPVLQYWHMGEKTIHGQADTVVLADRFVIATGVFDDSVLASAFKTYYANNEVSLSHGFTYDPVDLREGIYHDFFTFEISTLPLGKEANPYTAFIKGVKEMQPFTEEQKAALVKAVGEDLAASVFAEAQQKAQALDAQNVNYKADEKPPMDKEDEEDKGDYKEDDEKEDKALAEISTNLKTITQVLAGLVEQNKGFAERVDALEKQTEQKAQSVQGVNPTLDALVNDLEQNRAKHVDTRNLDYGAQQLLQSFGGKAFGMEK